MDEDVQANFIAVLSNLLGPKQEEVGTPPVVEQEVVPVVEEETTFGIPEEAFPMTRSGRSISEGLTSLLGGARGKAGDIIQRIGETFDPGIPEEAFPATTRRELERKEVPSEITIPPEKPTAPSEEQRSFNRLSIRELNPSAIAGIMGNIDVETGGTFAFDRRQDLYETGDQKGDGYGLFQFTDYKNKEGEIVGHLTAYRKYLEDNNLRDRPESQIDYVLDNIYSGIGHSIGEGNREDLREVFKSGSPEEVTLMFSRIFEDPQKGKEHNDRRVQSALKRFESITGNKQQGGMIARNPYPHNPRPI
jgi:hypothetical protein